MRVLVIDNYDSFTYNLVQYLGELGSEVEVVRNDRAAVDELLGREYERLVISPGPRTPGEAGISIEASRAFPEAGVPTLGVCLGHQAMVEAFGGRTIRGEPIHGKDAEVDHDGKRIFDGRAFPLPLLALPLAVMFIRTGLDDTALGLALVHTTLALPFAVLITFSLFSGIPIELEEAAWTLGCTRLQAFRKVVMPLALPGHRGLGGLRLHHLLERGLRGRGAHHREPHADRLPAAEHQRLAALPEVRRRRGAGRAGADLHLRRPQVSVRHVGHRQPLGAEERMAEIAIKNVAKHFGTFTALHSVDLTIADQEFMVLLGASGCGKTTLLRIIAGLETPSQGEVWIGGRRVDHLAPRDRGIAMVFQNYAVFPHLTVFENIAFGLRMAKLPQAEIDRRVTRTAELMHIEQLLKRYSGQLSGGQRQRVAVARALAMEPDVILMDEPLSNLDALLRLEMRAELKGVLAASKTTTIYVTHDQVEAMSLADRIAVMHQGRIVQAASPVEVYRNPAARFVGSFIGNPPMNFLPAKKAGDGSWSVAGTTLRRPAGERRASSSRSAPRTSTSRPAASRRPCASSSRSARTR